MTTIADLHARRADVRETAKAFLDDHRNNDGILSAEDNATHKQAFWNAMRPNASPLEVRNALSEGVDAEGGYLVPDEFEHTLVQSLADENIIRPLARIIQTTSGGPEDPRRGHPRHRHLAR